jgi:hypothetical protein
LERKNKDFIKINHQNTTNMKRTWMLLSAVAFLLPVLVQAQSSSYEDDLYYNPPKAKVITEKKYTRESPANTTNVAVQQNENGNVKVFDNSRTLKVRDVDEYNRRVPISDSEISPENDSANAEENDNKESTDAPYEYSERVRRFHNPDFTTQITDDGYLNIYVEDNANVNVYYLDDSSHGFMSPFFYDSNYYGAGWRWRDWSPYYSYYYDPWYSPWSFYEPWYYGGGFGFGWNPWYSGYYGYGYGYGFYPYYGFGGYYGYNGWGHSHNRYHLNSDQNRFLSNNGGGRSSQSRLSGNSYSRYTSTSSRSNSNGYALRSASSRSAYNSRTVTRSAESTDYSSPYVSRSRTSSSGSSSEPANVTRSNNSSSYTRSYTPSSSYRSGSGGGSSRGSSGGGSRGGNSGGRR